jgi:type I restriction enzyme, S subunit
MGQYEKYKNTRIDWLKSLPAHWQEIRLRATLRSCQNGLWGGEPNGKSDILCIRVADFDRQKRRVKLKKPTFRSVSDRDKAGRLLQPGDLLLEKSGGGDLQPVGVVVLYDLDYEAICSNFIARIKVDRGINSVFLNYLHQTLYEQRINVRSIKQTTGIQNLDSASYFREIIPLPPPSEQAAIVKYLDYMTRRIDKAIRVKKKLIQLLNEQKQVVIHQAVTRGLNPDVPLKDSGVPWLGMVPEHWEVRKVSQCFENIGSGTTPTSGASKYYSDGTIPWVNTGDLKPKYLNFVPKKVTHLAVRHYPTLKMYPSGTLLVAMYGATIGKSSILGIDACVNQACCALSTPRLLSSEFAYYVFVGLKNDLVNLSVGGGQPNISQGIIRNFRLPCPPLEEQDTIVSRLNFEMKEVDRLVGAEERLIDLLQEYRTRLIADVVTGQIDVRDIAAQLPDEQEDVEPFDLEDVEEVLMESEQDD